MTSCTALLAAALDLATAGYSVIPVKADGTKAPAITWKPHMRERASPAQLEAWFATGTHHGLGIVTGAISGNLELVEFEGRAIDAGLAHQATELLVAAGLGEVWSRLLAGYTVRSPSGGLHLFYRLDGATVPGNTKIARRPATDAELAEWKAEQQREVDAEPDKTIRAKRQVKLDGVTRGEQLPQVLIETRGEGGYVVAAPSAGTVHDTGRAWEVAAGGPAGVPTLTVAERAALHEVLATLDEMPVNAPAGTAAPALFVAPGTATGAVEQAGLSPADDYNARATWDEILGGHGWARVTQRGSVIHWRRPGKKLGISATTGHGAGDWLYAFTSASEFDPDRTYTKFGALAVLEHSGDHSAASSALRRAGYGDPLPERTKPAASAAASARLPVGDEEAFWTARPELTHLRAFARARLASPWAVLGVTLTRVLAGVPPWYQLPPIIGGHASLNLFLGIVAPSGGGKGAAEAAARDAIDAGDVNTVGIGSGEGILHQYVAREKGEITQHAESVLFTAAEVDTIAALKARQASTVLAKLREGWMGEELSFAYVDSNKRLTVKAHAYRMGLVVGIQPSRAAALLDDSEGGTPQRFLWMPGTDPDMPDTAPEQPEQIKWKLPSRPVAGDLFGRHALAVCGAARELIIAEHRKRARGDGDALDGHALLCRLKTGAALAFLNGHAGITDDDWTLAGVVMRVSDLTRASVVAHLQGVADGANRRRGESEAERAITISERVADAAVKRVCQVIIRKIAKAGGPLAHREARMTVASRDRDHFDDALDRLLDAGQIVAETVIHRGQEGRAYRLPEGAQ